MYKGSKNTNNDIITGLNKLANDCEFRVEESLKNREKLKTVKASLDEDLASRELAQSGVEETKGLLKKITEYLNEKKSKGLGAVYAAIYSARSIISNTSELELKLDGESAYLANEKGFNVNSLEGGGFRATLSMFITNRFLKAKPELIQTILFDELLATLDPENSASVSKYIELLSETSPMIFAEQKDAIFESINYSSYLFRKVDKKTTVRKERIADPKEV